MKEKVRILVECLDLIASVRVGVLDPLSILEKKGYCEVIFKPSVKINKNDLVWCDILISVRGSEFISEIIIKEAKKAGKFIIYFLDDDLLNLPEEAACSKYFNEECKNRLKNCILLSDVLWSSNEKILNKYKRFGNHIRTVKICPPVRIIQKDFTKQNIKTVNIIYAGSIDHTVIVKQYLKNAVEKIAHEFGEKVNFLFIGANPEIKNLNNVKYLSYIKDYDKYKEIVYEGNFHIGLAPMYTGEFFECKYFNKFIEYTSIGAVGIYTDTIPYKYVVKNGFNGVLCENDQQKWYINLKSLIIDFLSNTQTYNDYINNALNFVKTEFSDEKISEELINEIPELIDFKSEKFDEKKINLKFLKIRYYLERTNNLWKEHKIMFVPLLIYKCFKIFVLNKFFK